MTFQELSFHPNVVKPNRTMRRRLVLPAPHAIAFAHVIRLDYCTARNHVSSFLRRALRHLTASSRAFVHAPRTPPHPILNQLLSGIITVSPAPPFAKVRASYAVVIVKQPRIIMIYPHRRTRFPPLSAAPPQWWFPYLSSPLPGRSRRGD